MNWYETENWYAPLQREEPREEFPAREPAAPAQKPKRRSFWVVLTAIVLTCSLLLGLGIPAVRKLNRIAERMDEPVRREDKTDGTVDDSGKDHGFTVDPDGDRDRDKDDPEEEMPEDWDDFFANYYTDTDTTNSEVNIQQLTFRIEQTAPFNPS